MGALHLASKLEECPVRMRDLINVYDLLLSRAAHTLACHKNGQTELEANYNYTPMLYFSQTFYDMKDALVVAEMQILKRLGFNVLVVLPYGSLVNYLRLLGLLDRQDVPQKAWGYLNDAFVRLIIPSGLTLKQLHRMSWQTANARLCAISGANYRLRRHSFDYPSLAHPATLNASTLLVGVV